MNFMIMGGCNMANVFDFGLDDNTEAVEAIDKPVEKSAETDHSKMKPWERPIEVIYEEIRELSKRSRGVDLGWAAKHYRLPEINPAKVFEG